MEEELMEHRRQNTCDYDYTGSSDCAIALAHRVTTILLAHRSEAQGTAWTLRANHRMNHRACVSVAASTASTYVFVAVFLLFFTVGG